MHSCFETLQYATKDHSPCLQGRYRGGQDDFKGLALTEGPREYFYTRINVWGAQNFKGHPCSSWSHTTTKSIAALQSCWIWLAQFWTSTGSSQCISFWVSSVWISLPCSSAVLHVKVKGRIQELRSSCFSASHSRDGAKSDLIWQLLKTKLYTLQICKLGWHYTNGLTDLRPCCRHPH